MTVRRATAKVVLITTVSFKIACPASGICALLLRQPIYCAIYEHVLPEFPIPFYANFYQPSPG